MEGQPERPGGLAAGAVVAVEWILDALAEAVTLTELDGTLVFANRAALERMGVGSVEEARRFVPGALHERFGLADERGRPVRLEDLPGRRALRGEAAEPMLVRMVDGGGRQRWILVKSSLLEDVGGRRLALNVLEDVTEAKEREQRERFLADASELLASSLDYEETLSRVTRLAVPGLADWCAVELIEDGEIRQVAVAHVDPSRVVFARELRKRFPPSIDDPMGVGAVLRTGRGEHHPAIPDRLLVQGAADPEHLRILRELRMRSAMVAPLRTRGRVIGAITFVASDLARSYGEDDFAFVQDFAGRAADAVENARLYRELRETAEALRRSLLPSRLPEVPGWAMASRYRPASAADLIGGDFFDVFPAAGGFVAMIGDVTGKGIGAATLTALARHSAWAAALLGLSPAAILALLNRLLLAQPELSLVTAAVARVEGASLTVASAGHPLPLRHRPGEPPRELGSTGVLLGFDAAADWPQHSCELSAGEALLFYTDGVTDARRDGERFGERRLRAALAGAPADPEALLASIERELASFGTGPARDDMALLAARLMSGRGQLTAASRRAPGAGVSASGAR
jgi:hypothetical protein